MRKLVLLLIFAFINVNITNAWRYLVCYYDSASYSLNGKGHLSNNDLETALEFCTHLVYGYVGISNDNYKAHSLNEVLDIDAEQYSKVTSFKSKYPDLKVLLGVGGDHDIDLDHPDKYIELLEGGKDRQKEFIQSAYDLVKLYGFDGLDLAYQFPKNKPQNDDFNVDPKAAEHKEQFTVFVQDLKDSLRSDKFLLSLTVLPNVNYTSYFDIPALKASVDFVNLAAFDFVTPALSPEEANFASPLIRANEQAQYWLNNGFASESINLGVTSYGNAWKVTDKSVLTGKPSVPASGAAPEGPYSKKAGLLSHAEICIMLKEHQIYKDSDKNVQFGNYAFRPVKETTDGNPLSYDGVWISYEDDLTFLSKASYAAVKLGGVAFFNLGHDDFSGLCNGEKYPLLRLIHKHFQH